ncbi:hypothetical protein GQX74_011124 [Glossina fuscipes]|nr:hypothetical protein GQX74_011124 [Glossina fuscipes]
MNGDKQTGVSIMRIEPKRFDVVVPCLEARTIDCGQDSEKPISLIFVEQVDLKARSHDGFKTPLGQSAMHIREDNGDKSKVSEQRDTTLLIETLARRRPKNIFPTFIVVLQTYAFCVTIVFYRVMIAYLIIPLPYGALEKDDPLNWLMNLFVYLQTKSQSIKFKQISNTWKVRKV